MHGSLGLSQVHNELKVGINDRLCVRLSILEEQNILRGASIRGTRERYISLLPVSLKSRRFCLCILICSAFTQGKRVSDLLFLVHEAVVVETFDDF